MAKHLTVRMAWHDNKWNGRVCKYPEPNSYCGGTHSLLSDRIARNKNAELEKESPGEQIDRFEEYVPPCFWSCNAFSADKYDIDHQHRAR